MFQVSAKRSWLQCLAASMLHQGHDPSLRAQAVHPSGHSLMMTCTDWALAPPAAPTKPSSAEQEVLFHKGLIQSML